jgi:hypothetical protein
VVTHTSSAPVGGPGDTATRAACCSAQIQAAAAVRPLNVCHDACHSKATPQCHTAQSSHEACQQPQGFAADSCSKKGVLCNCVEICIYNVHACKTRQSGVTTAAPRWHVKEAQPRWIAACKRWRHIQVRYRYMTQCVGMSLPTPSQFYAIGVRLTRYMQKL